MLDPVGEYIVAWCLHREMLGLGVDDDSREWLQSVRDQLFYSMTDAQRDEVLERSIYGSRSN